MVVRHLSERFLRSLRMVVVACSLLILLFVLLSDFENWKGVSPFGFSSGCNVLFSVHDVWSFLLSTRNIRRQSIHSDLLDARYSRPLLLASSEIASVT